MQEGGPFGVPQAEGLEEAVEAVQEVEAEQTDGDDVEQRDDFVLKSEDDHVVDVGDISAGRDDGEPGHPVVFGHRIMIQRRGFFEGLGLHEAES